MRRVRSALPAGWVFPAGGDCGLGCGASVSDGKTGQIGGLTASRAR